MKVSVISISDRASRGDYEDLAGPEIEKTLRLRFPRVAVGRTIVPDEEERILAALHDAADSDFIITTGGTGISPRDITPEVTARFCEREIPGIAEALRDASRKETPFAMLSRGRAGSRGHCIVVNFPGSVKAVQLCMKVMEPIMEHAVQMLKGEGHEPA